MLKSHSSVFLKVPSNGSVSPFLLRSAIPAPPPSYFAQTEGNSLSCPG